MTTVNAFLLIFYTDIVGLNPAAVGTLFLIARIFDAFNDPILGFVVDHLPTTRWGRFRPYLVLAGLLCSINFVLLWLGPEMAESGKLAIAYVTYLALGITFPLMDIPLGALLPVMTADPEERNAISGVKGIAFLLIFTFITVITLPIINLFPDPATGWRITMILLAVFIFGLTLFGTWGVKERINRSGESSYTFRDLYTILFKTGPLGVILIVTVIINLGVGLNSGTAIFYYTYNLGNANLYSLSGVVTLAGRPARRRHLLWLGQPGRKEAVDDRTARLFRARRRHAALYPLRGGRLGDGLRLYRRARYRRRPPPHLFDDCRYGRFYRVETRLSGRRGGRLDPNLYPKDRARHRRRHSRLYFGRHRLHPQCGSGRVGPNRHLADDDGPPLCLLRHCGRCLLLLFN